MSLKTWPSVLVESMAMCSAVHGLCIRTMSSISIWGTLACLLTVKLEEQSNWRNIFNPC